MIKNFFAKLASYSIKFKLILIFSIVVILTLGAYFIKQTFFVAEIPGITVPKFVVGSFEDNIAFEIIADANTLEPIAKTERDGNKYLRPAEVRPVVGYSINRFTTDGSIYGKPTIYPDDFITTKVNNLDYAPKTETLQVKDRQKTANLNVHITNSCLAPVKVRATDFLGTKYESESIGANQTRLFKFQNIYPGKIKVETFKIDGQNYGSGDCILEYRDILVLDNQTLGSEISNDPNSISLQAKVANSGSIKNEFYSINSVINYIVEGVGNSYKIANSAQMKLNFKGTDYNATTNSIGFGGAWVNYNSTDTNQENQWEAISYKNVYDNYTPVQPNNFISEKGGLRGKVYLKQGTEIADCDYCKITLNASNGFSSTLFTNVFGEWEISNIPVEGDNISVMISVDKVNLDGSINSSYYFEEGVRLEILSQDGIPNSVFSYLTKQDFNYTTTITPKSNPNPNFEGSTNPTVNTYGPHPSGLRPEPNSNYSCPSGSEPAITTYTLEGIVKKLDNTASPSGSTIKLQIGIPDQFNPLNGLKYFETDEIVLINGNFSYDFFVINCSCDENIPFVVMSEVKNSTKEIIAKDNEVFQGTFLCSDNGWTVEKTSSFQADNSVVINNTNPTITLKITPPNSISDGVYTIYDYYSSNILTNIEPKNSGILESSPSNRIKWTVDISSNQVFNLSYSATVTATMSDCGKEVNPKVTYAFGGGSEKEMTINKKVQYKCTGIYFDGDIYGGGSNIEIDDSNVSFEGSVVVTEGNSPEKDALQSFAKTNLSRHNIFFSQNFESIIKNNTTSLSNSNNLGNNKIYTSSSLSVNNYSGKGTILFKKNLEIESSIKRQTTGSGVLGIAVYDSRKIEIKYSGNQTLNIDASLAAKNIEITNENDGSITINGLIIAENIEINNNNDLGLIYIKYDPLLSKTPPPLFSEALKIKTGDSL